MRATVVGTLVLTFLLVGCEDDPTGLDRQDVSGSYEATTLAITPEGEATIDALAEGASILLELREDGTTSGTLRIPGSLSESGEEEVSDLDGTYTVLDRSVTLEHEADTFLRDVILQVVDGRLEAERSFGDESILVVLERR